MGVAAFTVEVPDAALKEIRARLLAMSWPADYNNAEHAYGICAAFMRRLVSCWLTTYDWRSVERRMNAFSHYRVSIGNVPVHFMRAPSRGPAPIPLILSHGWPWTFWDMHKLIGPLADPAAHGGDPEDAFEVIVPSLPGFGFSTPLPHAPMNFWMTADLWHDLMTRVLGFPRFAAAGGDWGSLVSAQLGHKYAADLIGIHVTHPAALDVFNGDHAWDITRKLIASDASPALRAAIASGFKSHVSHAIAHVLDAQTLAYALHDSPVGLLAWIARRRRAWSDASSDWDSPDEIEHLITTTMIYWLTNSFVTSARYYADSRRYPWQPSHGRTPSVEAPTAISLFGGESLFLQPDPANLRKEAWTQTFNVQFLNGHSTGGHFAHYENPAACVADIRSAFRSLRSAHR